MPFNLLQKTCWKTNLRLLLVLPFVFQILAGLGVISYLSYRNGQYALEKMTVKLRKEIALRIENHVEQFIENGNRLNQINQDNITLNSFLLEDVEQLLLYFAHQYQWNNAVSSIAFASEKEGNYIEVFKQSSGDLQLTIFDKNKSDKPLSYSINYQGEIIKRLPTKLPKNYDPRQELWYQKTLASDDDYWYQIQNNSLNKQLIFTNSSKVYDQQGRLLGILKNHTNLMKLNIFLSNLKIGNTGIAFIIDQTGLLIAESSFNRNNEDNSYEQNSQSKSIHNSNKYIKKISTYVLQNPSSLNDNNYQELSFLDFNKEKPVVDIHKFTKVKNLEWLIILVVPESDFRQFITQNNRVTIILLIVALIIAVSSGLITSKLIVKPVIKLQKASEKNSSGRF